MFGYVLPRRDKLPETEQARYKAAYCGLCRCLKERYGIRGRFLVNYDMTFLYLLLYRGEKARSHSCLCPARPFCKKDCLQSNETMEYTADLTVLLSVYKLRDTVADGGFFSRAGAKLLLWFYQKSYETAAERLFREDQVFEQKMAELRQLEEACCSSIDRAADAFASILPVCTRPLEDSRDRRITEQILYHTGRFLYLTDALEDLPKDIRQNNYNPLRYRFATEQKGLTAQDKEELLESIEASVSMAAAAYELLPSLPEGRIVENIIYYGLSAVVNAVAQGSFRKRGTGK